MHDDYRPRTIRKLRQRRLEPLPQLAAYRRIAERSRNRFGDLLRISYLPAASQIERRVRDDSIEPRAKSLRRIEPVERLIRAQETLLHRIFRILVRHDDRACHDVRAPLMKTYEPCKTPFVPIPGQTYERSFLFRNTYGWVRLLRGCQYRWVEVLAVRYGRNRLTGVGSIPVRQLALSRASEPVPWSRARDRSGTVAGAAARISIPARCTNRSLRTRACSIAR